MTPLLLVTVINACILACNVGLMWVTIKIYSEILKIGHIQRIGK